VASAGTVKVLVLAAAVGTFAVSLVFAVAVGGRSAALSTTVSDQRTTSSQPTATRSGPPAVPANGSLYIGVNANRDDVASFDSETGISQPAIFGGYVSGYQPVSLVLNHMAGLPGSAPLISWGIDFANGKVTKGALDAYLSKQARAIIAYGKPVFLRPDWEMNGNWATWSPPKVTPAEYVASWRYIVSMFRSLHATNVAFVWSPNVNDFTSHRASAWYPGDAYVDWVGVDAYPRVSNAQKVVTGTDGLDQLAGLAASHHKPLMLAEWAATSPDPDTVWPFDAVFEWADRYPDTVKALVYFDFSSSTTNGDHLLRDHPVGAAEFRYLISRAPHILLTVQ
jgi:hypothetical protein